ncbi:DUF4347 domain-containing protein [Oceanospirillum sediminis]|uniref:DUF4347 domain-containing protein n=1 Tax=Oceanospirillum sediminis TaxID=2760088 RepID=A0A839ILY7_9GAMM|nr:DUF4347 domain-containing protein [Oceanospirillum sediminis]MBB1485532.1 DUF4347 domain-containing protein [Oceanospirillum sediminis]
MKRGIRRLIIADKSISQINVLIADLSDNGILLYIPEDTDSITVLTRKIAANKGVNQVYIFTHGYPTSLIHGSEKITSTDLFKHKKESASWNLSLSIEAEIMLYASNIAQGGTSKQFIRQSHELSGCKIAASSYPFGHIPIGSTGNWMLPVTTRHYLHYSLINLLQKIGGTPWLQS